MPQGIRDAVYVRTDYLKDLGLEAIDYRAALDREPCAFSHLWADNKVDVRNWRNREDTDALLARLIHHGGGFGLADVA